MGTHSVVEVYSQSFLALQLWSGKLSASLIDCFTAVEKVPLSH